jgi:alpha-amylase
MVRVGKSMGGNMKFKVKNGTIFQYFEWYLSSESNLWNKVYKDAKHLSDIGITAVWLPPAYKGNEGINDVGYTVYDLYDLGEFNQKGTVRTKYGTKDEYIEAIKELKKYNIQTYADVSLDHKIGADAVEEVFAVEYDYNNRNRQIGERKIILAWTKFDYPGRGNKYSDFKWNSSHFDGVDWDERTKKNGIYKFCGKDWDNDVDNENGNYDFLMGADIELQNKEVTQELEKWGKWYLDTTGIEGFRLDAVKHTCYEFLVELLTTLRKESGKELFTVGEYWNSDINKLIKFLQNTKDYMSLFDVPLHFNFYEASLSNGNYDMRNILNNTLMQREPIKAVSFVDNHDTQIGQALQSWVEPWFKPLAYSIILLREQGYPCVFYGDYYGVEAKGFKPINKVLDIMLLARQYRAYGKQNDYFDNYNIIGWTREGVEERENSGLAVLMSNRDGGSKNMYVGSHFAGATFYDCTYNRQESVMIDANGCGNFYVNGGSISIWIKK